MRSASSIGEGTDLIYDIFFDGLPGDRPKRGVLIHALYGHYLNKRNFVRLG